MNGRVCNTEENFGDKVSNATAGDDRFKITSEKCVQVPCLQCNQEEADTGLLLHPAHAAKDGFEVIMLMLRRYRCVTGFVKRGLPIYQL